ncbi:hypothetical protein EV182_001409, partial [Spiromyces aspiralis]
VIAKRQAVPMARDDLRYGLRQSGNHKYHRRSGRRQSPSYTRSRSPHDERDQRRRDSGRHHGNGRERSYSRSPSSPRHRERRRRDDNSRRRRSSPSRSQSPPTRSRGERDDRGYRHHYAKKDRRGGEAATRSRSPRASSARSASRDRRHVGGHDDVKTPSGERDSAGATVEAVDTDDEEAIKKLMGFSGFGTTKACKLLDVGVHVSGNDVGEANVKKQRKYRQYMNRKGGFNRPLDAG